MENDATIPARPTITVPEAARLLGISRESAYRAARTGELPTVTIGRRILVTTSGLRALVGIDRDPA